MSDLPAYVNINDSDSLVRDTFSMGVVNFNASALEASRRRHQLALLKIAEERQKEIELNTLRTEVSRVNAELAEMKELVMKLVREQK